MAGKDPAKAATERARIAQLIAVFGEDGARGLMEDVGSSTAQSEFERVAQVLECRKMLEAGHSRREISYRVAGRRGIAQSTAYDRASEALNLGPINLSGK